MALFDSISEIYILRELYIKQYLKPKCMTALFRCRLSLGSSVKALIYVRARRVRRLHAMHKQLDISYLHAPHHQEYLLLLGDIWVFGFVAT